jgi:hypothetical protein
MLPYRCGPISANEWSAQNTWLCRFATHCRPAGLVDGAALSDARDDVLQAASRGMVVEHVAHGHRRHLRRLRGLLDVVEPEVLVRREAADQPM